MADELTLVTGATGFIGSHLVDRLLAHGRRLRAMVNPHPIDDIEDYNLKRFRDLGVETVTCDIREKGSAKSACEGVSTVFHLAAISRPMRIPTQVYYDTNVEGTRNMLECCRGRSLRRFVHVSTVSVLGVSPDGHALTEDEFQPETHDYGLSKREGERVALDFQARHGVPVTVVRPPLTYGPRCVVRLVMFKAVKLGFFPLFGGGHARMELCYVDNLVDALLLAERHDGAVGQVYNITDGRSYEIREVIRAIQKHLKKKVLLTRMPLFAGRWLGVLMEAICKPLGVYPPFSRTAVEWLSRDMNVYDSSKAKRELHYVPHVSLDEGIARSVAWYRDYGIL